MRCLFAFAAATLLVPTAWAQGWADGPELTVPRRDAAVAVMNGEVYVIGGQNAADEPLGIVERLGPDDEWVRVDSLREERYGAAAVTYNGQILLMGGLEGDGEVTDDVEAFNPAENDWGSFESLKQARHGLGAAVLQGRVYALGGANADADVLLTTCEYYDAQTENWLAFPFWSLAPRRAAFGITTTGETAYLAGGFGEFGPLSVFVRYTIAGGTEALAPMPTARGGLALVADGTSLYAIGGLDGNNQVLDIVERYDIEQGIWEPFAPLNTARVGAVAAVVDGRLLVAGGQDEYGNMLSSVEVLVRPLDAESAAAPAVVSLEPAYPNPFSQRTALAVSLSEPASLSLRVYDVTGRLIATLIDGPLPTGRHLVSWDGRSDDGRAAASGVYLVRLADDAVLMTARITLVR